MADYTSQFTGSQIDARLAKVPQLETALAGKQATLVGSGAGQNIKTINNQNILGTGNIDAGSMITVDSALSSTSTNPVQNKVINTALNGKQATLVSGVNIATINNQSLLNGGNITIEGGGGGITVDSSLSSTSTNPVQNKVINTALGGKQDTISDLSTIRSGAAAGATAVQPSALSAKQDVLVSGTNIKTINNESILGSGNITIQGGGGSGTVTSVAMTVPTGLSVSGSPITTSGTLAVSLATGYKIPTTTELSALAPKASPALTGTPTAPTATAGTNTTQIATTAFVQNAFSNTVVLGDVIETI